MGHDDMCDTMMQIPISNKGFMSFSVAKAYQTLTLLTASAATSFCSPMKVYSIWETMQSH